MPGSSRARETLSALRSESVRRIQASEKAVERGFNQARLMASLAAGLLLVGFLLVAQWRGNATYTTTLERQSDQNLAIIIQELTTENSALSGEIMRLELRIAEAERATKDRGEVLNEAAKELNALRVISGLDPARGPGIRVTISDPEQVLLPQDFVALVNELRAGGAEAVVVDGVRVGTTSGFTGDASAISLDGVVLTRDFVIQAVGDPGNLDQALSLPGGLRATLQTFPGVTLSIEQIDDIQVPAAKTTGFETGRPYEEQ